MQHHRIVSLAATLFLFILICAESAISAPVHSSGCKSCHLQGYTINQIGGANVCLQCHSGTGEPANKFSIGDASNNYGNNVQSINETSHNWSSDSYNLVAGAEEPEKIPGQMGFFSRYGTTMGKIACSRCHNPHGQIENNPKLLVGQTYGFTSEPMEADDMCLACHAPWNQSSNHGWLTHPIVSDYNAAVLAAPEKFKTTLSNKNSADIQLVQGGISCTSCHGIHFVDSDSSTVDGPAEALNKSDGKLLRGDGPSSSDNSSLCQTCHIYMAHGDSSGEKVGCLVCHSGHSYDPDLPNYYVLRKTTNTATFGLKENLEYSSTDLVNPVMADSKYTFWQDQTDGTADGYCEKCHGDAVTIGAGAGSYHTKDAVCTDCHKHNNTDGGFMAACSSCHGDGSSKSWPSIETGGSYPNRQGAHEQHVTAIGSARGQSANVACDTCHPGTPPAGHPDDNLSPARLTNMDLDGNGSIDTDPGAYKRANGLDEDPLAKYDAVTTTCDNVGCHGGLQTLAWYWKPDTEAPTWAAGPNLIGADTGAGGTISLSWSTASDAYPSNPVLYDIYLSTTGTADDVYAGTPVLSSIITNSAVLTDLTDGTPYYLGVRAKDSAIPSNITNNIEITAGITPTSSSGSIPAGTDQSYYGIPNATSFGFDGSGSGTGYVPITTPGTFGRYLMEPVAHLENTLHYIRKFEWADSSFFNPLARLYLKPNTSVMESYPSAAWIGPDATGVYGSDSYDYLRDNGAEDILWKARLLDYNPTTGDIVVIGESDPRALPTPDTENSPISMTFPRYLLPHGHLLTLEIAIKPVGAGDDQVYCFVGRDNRPVDYPGKSTMVTVPVYQVPGDSTPPTWDGGVSGLSVMDTGVGGTLNITWNNATDADNPPVRYNLYRSTVSAADVWDNLYQAAITERPFVDTGLSDGSTYYYGVRAIDDYATPNETSNTDTTSGVSSTSSPDKFDCTSCHDIPPSDVATAGNHSDHADSDTDYRDCDHCHPGTSDYGTGHQNGAVDLGFDGAGYAGIRSGAGNVELKYTSDGTITGSNYYQDLDGAGGLNENTGGSTTDDGIDDGTCSNTNCHAAATPVWGDPVSISCGQACHGTSTARNGYAEAAGGMLQGAPPTDLAGLSNSYETGKHLEHINISYNMLGDSCVLCHENAGTGTEAHGNGLADVNFNSVAGASANWIDSGLNQAPGGTCGSLDANSCHGDKPWDPAATIACNDCHGFGGANPSHVTDNGSEQACTWCHPVGHPSGVTAGTVFIPNNASVGIEYASGGIHLLANINSRGAKTTEAEICWTCHETQAVKVSEWGSNNNATTGSMTYNSGTLDQSNWVGATWTSATGMFSYKTGPIQSTHSANDVGTSTLSGTDRNYTETLDQVADIRCSYCHDVHGRHLTWGGEGPAKTGQPYLRGTWMGNPYKEDGAPQSGTIYEDFVSADGYNEWGRVPRGSNNPAQLMGGYWIDQNSNNPTSGWTLESSAGLCILCHGSDVDNMDQETGEALWIATNGHSNAVLGGTTLHATNIFDARGGEDGLSPNPYQHFQEMNTYAGYQGPGDLQYGQPVYAFRAYFGTDNNLYNERTWKYQPYINEDQLLPRMSDHDDWAVDEKGTVTQFNYHQFSCSKCHNPHASRLPKLMITNCLDTKHNTWDNDYQVNQAVPGSNNYNRSLSNWTSAQNCHRLGGNDPTDARDTAGVGEGWNLVTPWD